jgi:hypothetical protein
VLPIVMLASCAHSPLPLDALMARVDVPRLLSCAEHLPDYAATARCLGVEAVDQGLRIAIDRALEATERAREAGHVGGAEVSDRDRQAAARELESAMDGLAFALASVR